MVRLSLRLLPVVSVFSISLFGAACGDDDSTPADAGVDMRDMNIPDGPQGTVLRIPETGRRTLPTLEHEVQVVYTESHVPHLYAETSRDLYVAEGFVIARDRYFTFEIALRLAQGKVSELLGSIGLATDIDSRSRGMAAIAARMSAQLAPNEREVFDAYAEGINAFVDAVQMGRAQAPSELAFAAPILGARNAGELMEHVTADDVISFAAVIVFQLGYESKDVERALVDRTLATMFDGDTFETLRRNGAIQDIWNHVAPVHDVVQAPNGFGLEDGTATASASVRRRGGARARPHPQVRVATSAMDRLRVRNTRLATLLHGGQGVDFGSNAWAVAGAATTDGATLLAGDGHLPFSVPALFYQMGLDTSIFGDGDTHVMGLFFPGYPLMAVGTNGNIAWSQTYLDADVTDWYAEDIQLDDNGMPTASLFQGTWRPLVATDEAYVIRNVPALDSVGRTDTWKRFETFDGRRLMSIEGRTATAMEVLGEHETLLNIGGDYVVPADLDSDGHISAISFDFTGFEVSNIPRTSLEFAAAEDVGDFREATRRFVAYAQNLVAADRNGGIYYGGYNAMPCRNYLPRDGEGNWMPGADPRMLLDGTTYAGFEIPVTSDGLPDEAAVGTDPNACLVPFDRWPATLRPTRGYVATANNDPAGIALDNSLSNDEYYIGGPWAPGYRAHTITERLQELVTAHSASVDEMARLQGDHRARFGTDMVGYLLTAIAHARAAAAMSDRGPDDERLASLYNAEQAAIDDVETRLTTWISRGAVAEAGVETFYSHPTADQITDSVATMLFNQWYHELYATVFGDEGLDQVFATDFRFFTSTTFRRIYDGRDSSNALQLASWNEATGESIFFDNRTTNGVVERSDEVTLLALNNALAALRAPSTSAGVGGFGTDDMNEWRWGMRHLVKFPSILEQYGGGNEMIAALTSGFAITPRTLPLGDGFPRDLPGFPRPGDHFAVDAANPTITRPDFFYSTGPAMRMVISLGADGHVSGQNVIPGGQSGITTSPYFADQARMWLGNEAIPLRFHVEDVAAGATEREVLSPP